jgi:predicted transcriptional regulator
MKSIEREKARVMRQEGQSVRDIAKALGVARSSVSVWVRDVVLTQAQIDALTTRNPIYDRQHKGAKGRQRLAREARIEARKNGHEVAKRKEYLHALGCGLYWGEGAKDRVSCQLANSDPYLLKVWLQFLHQYFPDVKTTLIIHCYTGNGLSVEEIENYWSDTLGIPKGDFRKTRVNPISRASLHKKPQNTLLYGTAHITAKKGMRIVQHIFGAIEEYGGFSTEFGLD